MGWLGLFFLLAGGTTAAEVASLEHRFWFWQGSPRPGQVEQARTLGVDSVVVPVAEVEVTGKQVTAKLTLPTTSEPLRGLPLWAAVKMRGGPGEGRAAEGLWDQVGPAVRGLGLPVKGLVLVADAPFKGLFALARTLQSRAGLPVEVAAPGQPLLQLLAKEAPGNVTLVALAFGNLAAFGWPSLNPQDAGEVVDRLDEIGVAYRGGVAVASRLTPALAEGGDPWSLVQALDYRPSGEGDVFVATTTAAVAGVRIPAGSRLLLQGFDASRLQRDLGILLRPVRRHLVGWDSIGNLPPAPALGLSWEGFAAFFSGELPQPRLLVRGSWSSPTLLRVVVENLAPFASAFATSGNFVDLAFAGTEVKDVNLINGAGADFGRMEQGFVRAPRGAASVVRLYLKVIPPSATVEVASLSFLSTPKSLSAQATVRLGDGREVSGPVPMLVNR
ncbi:MAG: hypothetical protein NZ869_04885 [Thermoanaerobaculum sp.]|nr:hypothetical protein [Thermoanaerobaculum sp.]MDW7967068.1 hypothetical protein [Thermoanaerobaculum sp.]